MVGLSHTGTQVEALVAIPGQPDGAGALAVVLRGEPHPRLGAVLRGGFDTLAVVPENGDPRPIWEISPAGTLRDGGPDALLAAAAALRSRVESSLGAAAPEPGGGYRVDIAGILPPHMLTPGVVGGALGVDPEYIADTGRLPALLKLGGSILVVPVEDRESVEEARPDAEVLSRLVQGLELVVMVVSGPEGVAIPEPVPLTVFRSGTWPRPQTASATAAAAVAAVPGIFVEGRARTVLFAPARAGATGESEVPQMRALHTENGSIQVFSGARRLV